MKEEGATPGGASGPRRDLPQEPEILPGMGEGRKTKRAQRLRRILNEVTL